MITTKELLHLIKTAFSDFKRNKVRTISWKSGIQNNSLVWLGKTYFL